MEQIFQTVAWQLGQRHGGQNPEVLIQGVQPAHFYFFAPVQVKVTPVVASGPDPEAELWFAMQHCGTSACLQAYLDTYPTGRFVTAAKALLANQTAASAAVPVVPPSSPPDPAAVEQALELKREERTSIQAALNALGHEVGAADGIWGRNTRTGISAWQRAAGREATGYLSREEYKLLLAQAQDHLINPATNQQPMVKPKLSKIDPEMIFIKGDCFEMGSPPSEMGRSGTEEQHQVCVESYWIGKYEVTFVEYDRFAQATDRAKPDDEGWGRGKYPVINVSFEDATAYSEWLSRQTGKRYRLPTEAEWEYAARAGTRSIYWWGNKASHDYANYGIWGWFRDGWTEGKDRWKHTSPVGSFGANPWGLHDTAGNVMELTCSAWNYGYKGNEQRCLIANDGPMPVAVRGGEWGHDEDQIRSAYRTFSDGPRGDTGFRLARK